MKEIFGDGDFPDLDTYEEDKTPEPPENFQIRPQLDQRFRSTFVKEVIHSVLHETLTGKVYGEENIDQLIKSIANTIRSSIVGQIYNRYKLIVHVELGEQRGAGVKSGVRCLWDPDCDSYATDTFISDSLFCVATVFGVYFY